MPEKEVRVIQSVQRAIDIINCFDEHELKLTLPQISAKLELNINTVRGLVNTLVANGYLEHVADGNCYMLGLAFLPKADLAGANDIDRLRSRVRPSLELIADRFQVSARMQIISNDNIFAVEVVNPIDSHYIFLTRLNTVFTLNATASGKLVLYYMDQPRREAFYRTFAPNKYTRHTMTTREELEADLEQIRLRGYSTEFDEFGVGISCIAVPILRCNGSLYGTVSIVASSSVVQEVAQQALPPMREFAAFVRKELL